MSGQDFAWAPGEVVDLPGAEAAQWADGVRAELVRDEQPETPEATAARPERAARKQSARRPRTETRTK
ncbi:hypothetical protein OG279_09635 [Streptomyces sp. NBC_01201]|uniref:hypothetical protein n=1 Tax=unclassified Streptomyces TaxID=2593676 RepID=UPI002E116B1A|nr:MULTISPECIES: hypothetical protein [unclassified Streptomyces]WSR09405.1 hypothetical protein OG265_26850 [Streptomyces sp. NBC_01208]WSR47867.1 hypothetical protein OG279_09635 [Streptomyces sp. NBC_01201]